MGYIESESREQVTMFPARLDDYVGEAHLARVVDRFIELQDLRELKFERFEPAATGRPGYDPRLMLKLYLYGYLNRVRSSRRLETEATRNVELMWLLGKLAPDFKSIADFRRDNGEAIRRLCREFTLFCVRAGLIKGELIAIDGSKFAGVNHKGRNLNDQKIAERLRRLDEKIGEYLKQLDANDQAEADQARPDDSAVRAALKLLEQRKAELLVHRQALAASGEKQISLTDPDTRAMKSGAGGAVVGYNVQMAVDAEHKLIVDFEATHDVNDRNQLARQALAVKTLLGADALAVVADAGYAHGAQYAKCEQAGITAYVPECPTHNNEARGLFGKQRFVYDPVADHFHCPAGQTLAYASTATRAGKLVRLYRTPACASCALRAQCTRAQEGGREIARVPFADATDAMVARAQNHPDILRRRKEIVEHPFGTIKRAMNQGYFLLKRFPKVTTEMSLTVLSYNLRRVMNILGAKNLIQALQPA
jgi:transposase